MGVASIRFCAATASHERAELSTAEQLARLRAHASRIAEDDEFSERLVQHQEALEPFVEHVKDLSDGEAEKEITQRQMKLYALQNMIPFIVFGFVDNFIMLLAGDLIDAQLGLVLGISTLASAAVGNTFSNVFGLWAGGLIESLAQPMGLPPHGLTAVQMSKPRSIFIKTSASVVGIVVGCIVGMCPLIWPDEYRLWEARSIADKE